MTPTDEIPQHFGTEFLEWLQRATERAWSAVAERSLSEFERAGVGGTSWRNGTHWTGGLSEVEVDEAERRYGLDFPADYRLFLRTLHATTPRLAGAGFVDDRKMQPIDRPGFFDWRSDDEEIRGALAWPLESLAFDVENNMLWPQTWGTRPNTSEERAHRLEELLAAAPKLIPIVGHRFMVPVEPHVVLSVYQSDIIVYGYDFRSFLLAELAPLLSLERDFGGGEEVSVAGVPFWGELAD